MRFNNNTSNMVFLSVFLFFFKFNGCKSQLQTATNSTLILSIFKFQNVNQCRRNEFYNVDYFSCVACNEFDGGKLQPSADKLFCKCPDYTPYKYETYKYLPTCIDICTKPKLPPTKLDDDGFGVEKDTCKPNTMFHCKFTYVNSTQVGDVANNRDRTIYVSSTNSFDLSRENCSHCDSIYNFRYQEYCIENTLLRPYIHFNAFWQTTSTSNPHFGDLKFVAFFCLALHNATACNRLANLCVLSHYSFDKNSPCSPFLLTLVSDVIIKYSNEREQQRAVRPFLFYKRGKSTARFLAEPIEGLQYELKRKATIQYSNTLRLFSTNYALDGSLKRWGSFSLSKVNLCKLYSSNNANLKLKEGIRFAEVYPDIECQLSLENLIDLARINANDNYINIFLNFSRNNEYYLQQLPILIETLTTENQRPQMEDWQLVKRFQLIQTHAKYRIGITNPILLYEDTYKLHFYRTLRYVQKFVLQYKIYNGNRIGVPIVRLSYRDIEINPNNVTLSQLYPYKFQIIFEKIDEGNRRQLLGETALPVLLLCSFVAAFLRANNTRKRRPINDICDISFFFEFLLQLVSNVAHALLLGAMLLISFNSIEYLTQRTVKITLPLIKPQHALELLIYLAFILKLLFIIIQLWRSSHFELFLIDWERPKSCDNNHFNLKSNLETSSVCSSVRTYVAENNVSAWRILFTANEWIRLSVIQKYSTIVQSFLTLIVYKIYEQADEDLTLSCFKLSATYVIVYVIQLAVRTLILDRIFGDPMQKFIDLCSMANISVFTLLEPGYGYYIHGRSPHGFADTDMSSMIMQLQREAQSMYGRRGLLSDSDKQAYIILPPKNLRNYLERLLIPFQRSCSLSQSHYQKEINTSEGNVERTSIAYASVNRFFCAFIDHAIKDMDYIIKEKSFLERFMDCEIDNYLTENKGTFYIDNSYSFGRLFLIGNTGHLFILEFSLMLSIFLLSKSLFLVIILTCFFNLLMCSVFSFWMRRNVSAKTLIDQRFLM